MNVKALGKRAKEASKFLAQASSDQKNEALEAIACGLDENQEAVLAENEKDLDDGKTAGLTEVLLDRLSLKGRLKGIANDIRSVIRLSDPVGEIFEEQELENGLRVHKVRVPLGVLGVIYESRPNVTLDVASLAIKTGNSAILRGGSETLNSNRILVEVIRKGLSDAGLPEEAIQFIDDTDRTLVREMLHMHDYVDLIIPRGGAALHNFCREHSTIPVVIGGIGICHLFLDATADLEKSLEVITNAKTQRPSVCNALDTLLLHEEIAPKILSKLVELLIPMDVSFRLDERAQELLPENDFLIPAQEGDWDTEWLSLVLGIKVVSSLEEAIEHIAHHSSGHSDGILTNTLSNADTFLKEVDSAAVYVNASTRFTDGSQLGLGAEVAISTQKVHARGPMGLRELTTYKWIIRGEYQTRK